MITDGHGLEQMNKDDFREITIENPEWKFIFFVQLNKDKRILIYSDLDED